MAAASLTLCSGSQVKEKACHPSLPLPPKLSTKKCKVSPGAKINIASACAFCYPTAVPLHLCGVNWNTLDLVLQSTGLCGTIPKTNLSICLLLHIWLQWSFSMCFRAHRYFRVSSFGKWCWSVMTPRLLWKWAELFVLQGKWGASLQIYEVKQIIQRKTLYEHNLW